MSLYRAFYNQLSNSVVDGDENRNNDFVVVKGIDEECLQDLGACAELVC